MSWSRSKRGRGSEVAAWTAGAFAQERNYPHHSEEARQLLEVHERLIHVFALSHAYDLVQVTSYGHFTEPSSILVGSGSGMVKTEVVRLAAHIVDKTDEPDEDRVQRLLDEAHQTQRTLTDAHSPVVQHGVTTPSQGPFYGDWFYHPTEDGSISGHGAYCLKDGEWTNFEGEMTDEEAKAFVEAAFEATSGEQVVLGTLGEDGSPLILTVGAGLLPVTEPTGSEGAES